MYDNYLFLGHGNTMQASEAFVQQGFCVRRAEVQNSTFVLFTYICAKLRLSAF
jgi:hypothetical protein